MTNLFEKALAYHHTYPSGKLVVQPSKKLHNAEDLSLAYSPGVAACVEAIAANPTMADSLTSRGHLVAVISNGTAILGLGDRGALASKPVMEGKAVLFKRFGGIDAFDLEVNEKDPDKLADIIKALEPTFGGINLEDIKSPDCFKIERRLTAEISIPVFHDDQHGTAIIVAATLRRALHHVNKSFEKVRCVVAGAGAAALATIGLLQECGVARCNIFVGDSQGLLTTCRDLPPHKKPYAQETSWITIGEALDGADIFIGLSQRGVITQEDVKKMAHNPIILALANPYPEIFPEEVYSIAPKALVATGRSDYPNQVNNVLCFPFMFRGALDVGARKITLEMKKACLKALCDVAAADVPHALQSLYPAGHVRLVPNIFDFRLLPFCASAVAEAAMASGVAQRPLENLHAYREQLTLEAMKVWQEGC